MKELNKKIKEAAVVLTCFLWKNEKNKKEEGGGDERKEENRKKKWFLLKLNNKVERNSFFFRYFFPFIFFNQICNKGDEAGEIENVVSLVNVFFYY